MGFLGISVTLGLSENLADLALLVISVTFPTVSWGDRMKAGGGLGRIQGSVLDREERKWHFLGV